MKLIIHTKPNSRKGPLVEMLKEGELAVYIREPAVDGKANSAVIKLLADHLKVSPSSVRITHGQRSRVKVVEVEVE